MIVKNGNSLSFALSAEEETNDGFFTRQEREYFGKKSSIPGGIEIGRYIPVKNDTTAGDWYFLTNERKIKEHVELTVSIFFQLVDNFQKWPSFNEYLKSQSQKNANLPASEKQAPFEYWWLTGKRETNSTIYDVLLYSDYGVFIRPDDKKVPLFTSSLYADMAGYHYSLQHNVHLTPSFIHCPTCFLTGTSALLGNRLISGGLLNEQWDIQFYTCDELMNTAPCYFCINDSDDTVFELTGCTDAGTPPLWVPDRAGSTDTRLSDRRNRIPWNTCCIN